MNTETAPVKPGFIYSRPKKVIRLHWFNAICWLVLTLSGLGIIRGSLRFMPVGYAEWLQNTVGGQFNLIVGHSLLGLLWAGVFALFVLFNWTSVVWPFLKKVLSITPMSVLRDMYEMVVDIAKLFGLLKSVKLAPPGRYNGAQRLLGTMIIGSSMAIALTGTLMFVLFLLTPMTVDGAVFRWSLVAHAFFVGLVYIGLVAHIYYALIEEPESLQSMTDGYLEEGYVKRHCPAWYDELKKEGRV
ncbi:MAG: cytochrome b/b6 domain-containing protein [Gammaproteobacteria bacterium]|nr:cytochrome b/b6 domain-containing protein [Gammaproteobacteria bacterium]